MSTNKNSTAIAPTYIIKKRKAKNSQLISNKIKEEEIKHNIRLTMACIVFFSETTKKEDNKSKKHKKLKINFINIYDLMKERLELSTFRL